MRYHSVKRDGFLNILNTIYFDILGILTIYSDILRYTLIYFYERSIYENYGNEDY